MALRLVIGFLKLKFPNVPVITSNELQKLMKTAQPRENLVLLVSASSFAPSRVFVAPFLSFHRTYSSTLQSSVTNT